MGGEGLLKVVTFLGSILMWTLLGKVHDLSYLSYNHMPYNLLNLIACEHQHDFIDWTPTHRQFFFSPIKEEI